MCIIKSKWLVSLLRNLFFMKDNVKKQLSFSTILIIWATKCFFALIYSRIWDYQKLHRPQFGTSSDVKLFYIGFYCLAWILCIYNIYETHINKMSHPYAQPICVTLNNQKVSD
jgi:hypothetical protein